MVKQTIQVFARVKPTRSKVLGLYELDEDTDGNQRLKFTVPKDLADGFINNKKEDYKFRFEKIFDQKTKQEDVFEHVSKPVIDNVLQGYNGTIFAYGQTGSGKTFTITGGAERYADRGIIPRTLSYIFEYYNKHPELEHTTHVSYLELYNESGYDLLDPKHEASKLEDLPKVSLMEDAEQNIHLRNLSLHQASNEEEALNLLFLGDTNRMIAETPMNQASTRSHCIFTIHVMTREAGSATVRRAKCHLVDLAGSERVSKTGVNGLLLTEAKYINLSLHYLEQVIVALSEKRRAHIPYRNSMMTSVLRDSLGGNCMTSMIATCSVEKKNIDESISTCRFAQRVAMIKNDAILNEELDPKLMIAKLKGEIQRLKEELAMATGEQRTDQLTEEEIQRCQQAVQTYLEETDPDAVINVGADMRKIHECFRLMKSMVRDGGGSNRPVSTTQSASSPPAAEYNNRQLADETGPYQTAEAQKLKDLVMQRDNEINILVGMLKKEKKRAADALAKLESLGQPGTRALSVASDSKISNGHARSSSSNFSQLEGGHRRRPTSGSDRDRGSRNEEEKTKKKILGDLSIGRQEAFEIFRRDYEQNDKIDENKHTLKRRYGEAKSLGEEVNTSRKRINKLKAQIEQYRMTRVMQGLVDPENPEPDETEEEMKNEIENEKSRYKACFNKLRNLKTEIEHLQHFLEKSKVKLMKDFEIWWAEQAAAVQEQQQQLQSLPPGKSKSAWRTPPLSPTRPYQAPPSTQESIRSDNSISSNQAPIPRHIRQSLAQGSSTFTRSSSGDTSGYSSQQSSANRAHRKPSRMTPEGSSSIQLTGDAQADADIMAFLKARQSIIKSQQHGDR